jgi:hypothetical protein
MFEKYYSIAQSYSTQYLSAQIERLPHRGIKYRAFLAVLKTRLLRRKKHPQIWQSTH